MSSVPKGSTPVFGTRSFLVGLFAALVALAFMAAAAAGTASARDIVISDSSSPLSAGAAGPNFAGTAITAGSAAQTQSGNCLSPNVSIRPSAAGAADADDVRLAIQAAVNPVALGVQAGDNVYFCNVAATGTGTPAVNTYAPDEAATAGQAVDLSVTPSITIAAYPGQTPTLRANAIGDNDYSFFVDSSTQGREFTFADLTLEQGTNPSSEDGGFVRVDNPVNAGALVVDNVTANGFEVDGGAAGGVIAAENVEVVDSSFGTTADNEADASGGAIAALEDVLVVNSDFGLQDGTDTTNIAGADGGAIASDGDVFVDGATFEGNTAVDDGGAIAAVGVVEVVDAPSVFIGEGTGADAGGDGGAISAQSVLVANASRFGVDTTPDPDVGIGLAAGGNGGAIATYNITAGCADATTGTPCVPGVVEVTGAAIFGDNVATGAGGAIYAEGGATIDGTASGVKFISTPTFVNEAAGGGAIAVGGLFDGANTVPSPRACTEATSLTNLNLSGQIAAGLGGGAIHVLASATDATDVTKRCAVTISGNTFTGNATNSGPGGAIFIGGGNVTADDNVFTSNATTVGGDGGAVATGGNAATATRFPTTAITNSEFTTNVAFDDGGAVANGITAANEPTMTISDVAFTSNAAGAAGRGGAVHQELGSLTLEQSVLTTNSAPGGGGALSAVNDSTSVSEVEFDGNTVGTAGNGGAVLISGAGITKAEIEKAEFTGNKAGTTTGLGGAVFQALGTPASVTTISEALFEENEATGSTSGSGGAIASTHGGAPPAVGLALDETEFLSNKATTDGGAINTAFTAAGVLSIQNSDFAGNQAVNGDGGAINMDGTAVGNLLLLGAFDPVSFSITADGGNFSNNAAGDDGGAIDFSGANNALGAQIVGSIFGGNQNGRNPGNTAVDNAAADGGAINIADSTGGAAKPFHAILGNGFLGNTSADDGGAISSNANGDFFAPANQGIGANTFIGNAAGAADTLANQESSGGAVNLGATAGNQAMLLNTFTANTVKQTNTNAATASVGGAVSSRTDLDLRRNTFSLNEVGAPATAFAAGGAVHVDNNPLVSVNSTYFGNKTSAAASVAWAEDAAGTIQLLNSTLAANNAPLTGSLLKAGTLAAEGTLTIQNSILSEGLGVGSECEANTLTNGGGNVLTDSTDCADNAFVGGASGPAAKVTAAALDLKPLANNGNDPDTVTLQTMALGLDSVAKSSAGTCTSTLLRDGTGGTVPADERGLERPTSNCSSGAYQLTTQTLTVSKSGSGKGTVTSSPAGIDCGPDCDSESADFAESPPDTTVTLTATPQAGSAFVSWSGPCVAVTATTCDVELTGSQFVTANFRSAQNTLTVAKTGNGEGKVTSNPAGIDCGTSCVANFAEGSTVTLTAEAQGNSTFDGWSGACASAGTAATCTVTMDQTKTASANFTQTARARIVKVRQGTIRVPSSRKIKVGRVECVNGNCQVVQATARVTARGRTYTANVNVNRDTFTTGQSRTATVVVPKAAYKRLRSSKSGSVSLVLRAEASLPGSFTETNKNLRNGLRR